MDTFGVDKVFYEDLTELWDSDMEPVMHDVLREDGPDCWTGGGLLDSKMPGVVLHDRLMTDAALGAVPIKTEHSYSLASDGDSMPESPISLETMEDDDDLLLTMNMKKNAMKSEKESEITFLDVKQEPLSSPPSPDSSSDDDARSTISVGDNENPITMMDLVKQESRVPTQSQSLLKQPQTIYLTTRGNVFGQQQGRVVIPKLNIKVEPGTAGFSLPPTPPSSNSSDSEGNVSPLHGSPPSPLTAGGRSIQARQSSSRLYLSGSNSSASSNSNNQAHCRQPIQTPLISTQPKGTTGMLSLTEEEKRTLLAEGYPIPTRLPLTKAEEKSLKKIRRKIKNKISAQESRRKKKEYMDALEKRVENLLNENCEYKKKIESLEGSNSNLLSQLHKLQQLVNQNNASAPRSRASASSTSHHFTRNSLK